MTAEPGAMEVDGTMNIAPQQLHRDSTPNTIDDHTNTSPQRASAVVIA